jgi:anaerobic magnesium-protoporphyrin IX monomethyl ester cyclase
MFGRSSKATSPRQRISLVVRMPLQRLNRLDHQFPNLEFPVEWHVAKNLSTIRIKHPRFLLMYSALQFAPDEMAKPDGSLSLPYVAGALRRASYDVDILDVSVGGANDKLEETFLNPTELPSGLIRCGMSLPAVAECVREFDVIGISSIFTTQTTMVLELVRHVKEVDPAKLVIAGGVNARHMRTRFFDAGVDIIALSESEHTIELIAEALRGKRQLTSIPGIAYLSETGREVLNAATFVLEDLDKLPMPAWDLLPLQKYWDLSRPHGGQFPASERIKYGSLQTSRGCPFRCTYCHISRETAGDASGSIGGLRLKSIDRVLSELQILKDLGAEYVFFEDDSLFAKKNRAYMLFKQVADMNLRLLDVNGINLVHLFKNAGGRLDIDIEFLEVLAEAGFHTLTLPFESANQRLIDKYASAKWTVDHAHTLKLIAACDRVGITTAGNYMIGFPDETLDEIHNTILMAKSHVEAGMNHGHFFAVVPFPGTKLYDMVIDSGQLDSDFNPDQMKWTKSMLKNLAVPAETLEHLRQLAWLTVNRQDFVQYKVGMRVNEPRRELPTLRTLPIVSHIQAGRATS